MGRFLRALAARREQALAKLGKGPVITWYDVLGLLPGAPAAQVKSQHDAKVSLLRPELIAGAPSPVVRAATRAREILDLALGVLADPASRARYDEAVGIVRRGEGLARPDGFPSEPGLVRGADFVTGVAGAEVRLGLTGKLGLRVTTVRLTAHPMPVDGLVVAQSPGPATRARRGSALTVQVWHPPARSVIPGHVIR